MVKFYVIYILTKAFLKERTRKYRRQARGRRTGERCQERCKPQRSTRFPQGGSRQQGPQGNHRRTPRVELVLDHSHAGKLKASTTTSVPTWRLHTATSKRLRWDGHSRRGISGHLPASSRKHLRGESVLTVDPSTLNTTALCNKVRSRKQPLLWASFVLQVLKLAFLL